MVVKQSKAWRLGEVVFVLSLADRNIRQKALILGYKDNCWAVYNIDSQEIELRDVVFEEDRNENNIIRMEIAEAVDDILVKHDYRLISIKGAENDAESDRELRAYTSGDKIFVVGSNFIDLKMGV